MDDWKKPPRLRFLVALGGALVAWWAAGDPSPPAPAVVEAAPTPPPAIVDTLQPDQTLSGLWARHGLDPADLPRVVEAGMDLFPWRSLRPGVVYKFTFTRDGSLRGLDVRIDRDRQLVIRRSGPQFTARLDETPFVRRSRTLSTCVDGSLWEALAKEGEDPGLAVRMSEALAAQVDFYTDLQAGDCVAAAFTVDARPDGSYRLVDLESMRLAGRKKTYEAYRFSPDGERQEWYDADGQSLRRRFLRSPLKFVRISSRFGVRMHPVLHQRRAHLGVDYAAPMGTPVQASGDGVVRFAGRRGGYGNHVEIRHGKEYVTMYSHLSRVASGVRPGAHVSQGQIIGYVGSTGLATGPHLDYRFLKDGKYVDPLSTDLPIGTPLEGDALARFAAVRDELRARMDAADRPTPPGSAGIIEKLVASGR